MSGERAIPSGELKMPAIKVDIEELIMALESQAEFGEFFLDKESGEIILISNYTDDNADVQRERLENEPDRFLYIQPIASRIGWDIMNDFMHTVSTVQVQEALARALNGRKPFRSFKEELLQFPDIREQWFAYHAARMTELARHWLEENDIVSEDTKSADGAYEGNHFTALREMTAEDEAAGLTFREQA
jgi:hypothetical protein